MQILLGAHETVIKINSSSIKIDYIQHFISTHFFDRTIINNSIFIPQSKEHSYHRIFLLKWLYTLYSNKTQNKIPELKDSLVNRQHKAIKIVLPQKIIHEIQYKVINNNTIHLQIIPANNNIAYKIKTYLQTKVTILPSYLSINITTQEQKDLFRKFLAADNIIDIPHKHIYDSKRMKEFLSFMQDKKCMNEVSPLENAYLVLGLSSEDNAMVVKKRYKTLAKKFHPDVAILKNQNSVDVYTKKFQDILQAYEILSKRG